METNKKKELDPLDVRTKILMATSLINLQLLRIADCHDDMAKIKTDDVVVNRTRENMKRELHETLGRLHAIHERVGDFMNGQDMTDRWDEDFYVTLNTIPFNGPF